MARAIGVADVTAKRELLALAAASRDLADFIERHARDPNFIERHARDPKWEEPVGDHQGLPELISALVQRIEPRTRDQKSFTSEKEQT